MTIDRRPVERSKRPVFAGRLQSRIALDTGPHGGTSLTVNQPPKRINMTTTSNIPTVTTTADQRVANDAAWAAHGRAAARSYLDAVSFAALPGVAIGTGRHYHLTIDGRPICGTRGRTVTVDSGRTDVDHLENRGLVCRSCRRSRHHDAVRALLIRVDAPVR